MQRNGRKLADVLDWAVPGQAVVKLGHNADIDTRLPRLAYDVHDNSGVAGCGEENLVRETLARQLQQLIDGAERIAGESLIFRFGPR